MCLTDKYFQVFPTKLKPLREWSEAVLDVNTSKPSGNIFKSKLAPHLFTYLMFIPDTHHSLEILV